MIIYCDQAHDRVEIPVTRDDFDGVGRVNIKCIDCGLSIRALLDRWTSCAEKLKASGLSEVSMQMAVWAYHRSLA